MPSIVGAHVLRLSPVLHDKIVARDLLSAIMGSRPGLEGYYHEYVWTNIPKALALFGLVEGRHLAALTGQLS